MSITGKLLTGARRRLPHAAVSIALAATLHACSSDGGGISGTSLVIGPITDFGSIVVGDVTFDIDNAEITVEGDPAGVEDLERGMIVRVRGTLDRSTGRGDAERVAADHLLLGTVQGANDHEGTLSALSQLIITDAQTVFAGFGPSGPQAGENVEVFGFRDADGSIRATRLASPEELDEIELTGTVSALDEDAMTFRIGLLTVDYGDAELDELPEQGLSDGLIVEVEAAAEPIGDLMIAAGVEAFDTDLMLSDGDTVDLEGFVTSVTTGVQFELGGTQTILITPDTRFERGEGEDLAVNTRVDVDAIVQSDGTLIATEVDFLP